VKIEAAAQAATDRPPQGATATVPATCGELVQGVDGDGPFLVSCPIDLWSTARCTRGPARSGLRVVPADRTRTAAALAAFLEQHDGASLEVQLEGRLPTGRGYGSSTADIASALSAAAALLGTALSTQSLGRLATAIEPTDSSFAPGLAVFDHVAGDRLELLGEPPAAWILIADRGIELTTAAVHRRAGPGLSGAEPAAALELLRAAVAEQDVALLGRASTLSAQVNQRRLPNPLFEPLRRLAARCSGAGVVVAHSGTLAGVLFADPEAAARGQAMAARELGRELVLRVHRLCGGGVDVRTTLGDTRLAEGRHLVENADRRLHEGQGEHGPGALAQPQIEIQQRAKTEAVERDGVTELL